MVGAGVCIALSYSTGGGAGRVTLPLDECGRNVNSPPWAGLVSVKLLRHAFLISHQQLAAPFVGSQFEA
jgi:hypothetical protein